MSTTGNGLRFASRQVAVGLVLVCAALAASAQPTEAETKFQERATKTHRAIADALARLGADCLKQGLNLAAVEHLQQALEHEPGNEKAMKSLGHEKKKVDGENRWVLDPKKAPPAEDAKGVTPAVRTEYRKARDKIYADAAKELVALGQFAARQGLEAHARVACESALAYNPLNEDALKGAGWVKDGISWTSPREILHSEAARKALANPPESQELDKVPEWATGLGDAANPVTGHRAGKLTVLTAGVLHSDLVKYAAAVQSLAASALGGEAPELLVFCSVNRKQQQAYATMRHPGNPGLAAELWCVAGGEVAVEADEKDFKVTMERLVLAVAMHEVRSRCGEVSQPWFELGFASNMTRRLCGSVALIPFAGKAEGPSEPGRWKRTLLQKLADETQPRLDKLVVTRDPDEHQVILAHFFTRYLVQERSACLEPFCAALKAGETMEDALKSASQTTLARLEQGCHGWLQRGG
ncbi:MAG: hypothetical protein KF754_05550 [Planctomycetes bacterium]|nr:hypothetical protein [Planctomycetota bacterium]